MSLNSSSFTNFESTKKDSSRKSALYDIISQTQVSVDTKNKKKEAVYWKAVNRGLAVKTQVKGTLDVLSSYVLYSPPLLFCDQRSADIRARPRMPALLLNHKANSLGKHNMTR